MPVPLDFFTGGGGGQPGVFFQRKVWLTNAAGAEIDFDQQTYLMLYGANFGPAPADVTTVPFAQRDGVSVRQVRLGSIDYFVPCAVQAESSADLRNGIQALERLVDPKRGMTTIHVQQPDGEQRSISGYAKVDRGDYDIDYQLLGLTLTCPDPYWQGLAIVSSPHFHASSASHPLLGVGYGGFPARLGSSSALSTVRVTNDGDADAYPLWTFTGPFTSVVVTNLATGKVFTLTGSVATGHSRIVDTTPTLQTVRGEDGVNRYAELSADSALFGLTPGDTDLRIELAAPSVVTAAAFTYPPRFRAA